MHYRSYLQELDPRRLQLSPVWASVIDDLASLRRLAFATDATEAENRAEAARLHARLMTTSLPKGSELPAELQSDGAEHRRLFVQAVLAWTHFGELGMPDEILDTVPSETLRDFAADLPPDAATRATIVRALQTAFAVSDDELATFEAGMAPLRAALTLRRAISAELRRIVTRASTPPAPEERLALMTRFYGPLEFRADEVDLLLTSTSVLFLLPYENDELVGAGWDARDEAAREGIRTFLRRLHELNNAKSDRFPSFGMYDRRSVDRELVETLWAGVVRSHPELAATRDAVEDALATMVSIQSSKTVDQYVIHDVWGHAWQGILCDFTPGFERLFHISEPLRAESVRHAQGESSVALRDAFVVEGDETRLDEAALLRFAKADVRERMVDACGSVLAEVLADVVEGKFIRQQYRARPSEFPTSSLLPKMPVKLDLTLRDIHTSIDWWRQPYLSLSGHASERLLLEDSLARVGLPRAGLADAVRHASQLVSRELASVFSAELEAARRDDQGWVGNVGIYERLGLMMLLFERALEPYLAAAAAPMDGPRWRRPRACLDLVVIALGWFYCADRRRNLWRLDSLLENALLTSLNRLERALRDA